jgi:LacI family transcriptional regulator
MGNLTIRMLAEKLGLSVGSVSKALRDSPEISTSTRKKVQELARELHYVPNPYASSLRRKRSGTIAVVLPEVADHFFSSAIDGIESIAQANGYHTLIYLTHESPLREEAILQDFQGGRVDGILISLSGATTDPRAIRELVARNIPVIFFDRVFEELPATRIVTDDLHSSYQATRCLLEKGCRKIAYLSISSTSSIMVKRMEGYKKALAEYGFSGEDVNCIVCEGDAGRNYTLIKDSLASDRRPDGIIASVEKLAITTYQVCHDLQLSIPGDIKIIAFSNQASAALLDPSLTTITQPAFEMGRTAAAALFRVLQTEEAILPDETTVLPSKLIERESTG